MSLTDKYVLRTAGTGENNFLTDEFSKISSENDKYLQQVKDIFLS
jgi:urate oxidase